MTGPGMNKKTLSSPDSSHGPTLQAQDIVAGLGAAPRDLLATCVALFDDGSLWQRLAERIDTIGTRRGRTAATGADPENAVSSLTRLTTKWKNAPLSDDDLRLMLWMFLREAFDLPARTFGSLRSARTAADDLVAAALVSLQPGTAEKLARWVRFSARRKPPDSLDDLARQTLTELIENVLDSADPSNAAAREALVRETRQRVEQMDSASQHRLLDAIGARELNDDAIRTILLTGGGLATFGGAVSVAGFSAYIFAAQVSAFVPLVSGPALVSFVAVLSNPVTIVLATLGTGWWAARSVGKRVQGAIALRVMSLLALTGVTAGNGGLRQMAQAFVQLPVLGRTRLLGDALDQYQADWKQIAAAHRHAITLSAKVASAMERTVQGARAHDHWQRLLQWDDGAVVDMGVMSVLTLGELLYNIYALDPAVLKAADFSRIGDLSNSTAFAAFAHQIESMDAGSHLGAISSLKGYVAEQVVASQLVEQGHVVDFPPTANEAGWDIAVDGIKFQVKNAADLDLLERHFDKGYDYPILANAEIAELLADTQARGAAPDWADHVHFVEGYSQASVQEAVDQTIDAGDGMLHPHVPTFAVTLCAIRQFCRYRNRKTSATQAVQEVLIQGSITAGLAVTGNYAGVAIGLLVFGPAGAVVLGSALPILSRTQTGRARSVVEHVARGEKYRQWKAEAEEQLQRLLTVLAVGLNKKAHLLKARAEWSDSSMAGEYLRWRLDDDVRFLRETWLRLKAIRDAMPSDIEGAWERLISWLSTSTLHPVLYQTALREGLEVLGRRPGAVENISDSARPWVEGLRGFMAGAKGRWGATRSGDDDL